MLGFVGYDYGHGYYVGMVYNIIVIDAHNWFHILQYKPLIDLMDLPIDFYFKGYNCSQVH
jgi:hypothetical protein